MLLSGAERTLGRARACRAGGGTRKPRCSGSGPRTRPRAGRSRTSARPTTWARCRRCHRRRWIGCWIVRERPRDNVGVSRAHLPEPGGRGTAEAFRVSVAHGMASSRAEWTDGCHTWAWRCGWRRGRGPSGAARHTRQRGTTTHGAAPRRTGLTRHGDTERHASASRTLPRRALNIIPHYMHPNIYNRSIPICTLPHR